MPEDDSFVNAEALARLTKTFEAYGASVQDRLKARQGDADSAVPDGSAIPAAGDELKSAYAEMANLMVESLNALERQVGHLDDALRTGQRKITETENSAVSEADQPRPV